MRAALFFILMFASAMAGKKYLIETGIKNVLQDYLEDDLKSSPIGKGKSCKYEGKVYKDGERMPCGDGCNSRFCINGKPGGCTKMGCVRFKGSEPRQDYQDDEDNQSVHKTAPPEPECR